jgi:hypothetical protein
LLDSENGIYKASEALRAGRRRLPVELFAISIFTRVPFPGLALIATIPLKKFTRSRMVNRPKQVSFRPLQALAQLHREAQLKASF